MKTRADFNYNDIVRSNIMPFIKSYFDQRELDFPYENPGNHATSSLKTTNSTHTTLECSGRAIQIFYDIDSENNVTIKVDSDAGVLLDVKEHHLVDLLHYGWLDDNIRFHEQDVKDIMDEVSETWHDIFERAYEAYQP